MNTILKRVFGRSSAVLLLFCTVTAIWAHNVSIAFFSIDFPGSTNTQAAAITPSGEIVGRYFTADGKQHGFTLVQNMFKAVDVPGASTTDAGWVNARGDIVGTYHDVRAHAYVLSGGTFTTIDFPSVSPVSTVGFGISDRGDVVGVESAPDDFNHGHGYLFSRGMFSLIDFPGATGTFPTMVLDSGEIVGAYMDSAGVVHGFQRSSGTFDTIDFPDSTFTWITGINPEGDIVGFYNSQDGKQHGFVLRKSEFISVDIPGGISSEVNGINAQGDVVGRYITPQDGNTHGYFLRCGSCTPRNETE